MKRLPLYDESADIACTITSAEIPDRIDLVERLRRAMLRLERSDHGMVLHFAPDAETESDVRRFAVDEKRCCQFWGFDVESSSASLALRWDGPPKAQELINRLASFLEGDEPASSLRGLL